MIKIILLNPLDVEVSDSNHFLSFPFFVSLFVGDCEAVQILETLDYYKE